VNDVNRTLYIPLYGKALVSRKGILLQDPKAEEIWAAEGFPLGRRSRSKWLAYYMGMRSAVFDRWLGEKLKESPDAVVLHLGCGMDSRCVRVGAKGSGWFDVDFPAVIAERRRYYRETDHYRMIPADITAEDWLEELPRGRAIVVMEGVSMYLEPKQLETLLDRLAAHFDGVSLLMDCYSSFAARASRFKNPINDVGVTQVYGMDDPEALPGFCREHDMNPRELIDQLSGLERVIFRRIYAGGMSRKIYRLYEYRR